MKNITIKIYCCAMIAAFTSMKCAAQDTFVIDAKASSVTWTGHAQTGVYSPKGTIAVQSGSMKLSGNKLMAGDIAINMGSLHPDKPDLESHLKNEDFFDVAKFPTATFVLKSFKENIAQGLLTIKGITKSISFPLSLTRQGKTITLKGHIQVDRTVYGIKYKSLSFFQDAGSYAIKNEFELDVDLIAIAR